MRLYHPGAYDFSRPVKSYWEDTAPPLSFEPGRCDGAISTDVAIIGAGYTGLSAALGLCRRHGLKVTVLDAGTPGWGASGRNGGFCSAGSAKLSYPAMIRRFGMADTQAFHHAQCEAIGRVRAFLDDNDVEADVTSGGDYRLAHRRSRVSRLHEECAYMNATFATRQRVVSRGELAECGYGGPQFHAGLFDPDAFGLHPLKYLRGLAEAAARAGATILADSEVTGWRTEAGRHLLRTPTGEVSAARVLLATNGYTPEGLAEWVGGRLLPALTRIIVTRPLSEAERQAQGWTGTDPAHDTRELLHYFRLLPDNRFLFGGRGGLDASPEGLRRSYRRLRAAFEAMFPAWTAVETEYSWAGFVCLTWPLTPYAGPLGDVENAWGAFAYHGNGVAMGSHAGALMADVIAGAARLEEAVPAIMRHPLPRFPLARWRKSWLAAAYAGYSILDNWA